MTQRPDLDQLSADQLRALATELFDRVENKEQALVHRDAVIEKLTHEVAKSCPVRFCLPSLSNSSC